MISPKGTIAMVTDINLEYFLGTLPVQKKMYLMSSGDTLLGLWTVKGNQKAA